MTPRERAVERIAQFAVDTADGGDLWSGMSAAERAPALAVIRALFEELGLVAVDRALTDRVRADQKKSYAPYADYEIPVTIAEGEMFKAVLAQLGAKP